MIGLHDALAFDSRCRTCADVVFDGMIEKLLDQQSSVRRAQAERSAHRTAGLAQREQTRSQSDDTRVRYFRALFSNVGFGQRSVSTAVFDEEKTQLAIVCRAGECFLLRIGSQEIR